MHTLTFSEIWYVFLVMVLFFKFSLKNFIDTLEMGHTVAQLVEALRYKPEGRGFDS